MASLNKFVFINALLFSIPTLASFPPTTRCTNVGNTIQVTLEDDVLPGQKASVKVVKDLMTIDIFKIDEVEVKESDRHSIAKEKRACTKREVFSLKYTIKRKDSKAMPNAYNRLAEADGSLKDYFLCTTFHSWLPQGPNKSCD